MLMRPFPLVPTFALAAALALGGCATPASEAPAPPPPAAAAQVPTQLPRNVRPLHYSISAVPDAANLRFAASALIDVEVLEPTETIILNAAELDFASAAVVDGARARVSTDADAQTATLRFPERLSPGRHRLAIDYSGRINTQAAGLFALDYTTDEGPRRALFTQFEAPDARRFFPSGTSPISARPTICGSPFRPARARSATCPRPGARPVPTAARSSPSAPPRRCRATFCSSRSASSTGSPPVPPAPRSASSPAAAPASRAAGRSTARPASSLGTTIISAPPTRSPSSTISPGRARSQFFGAMENWGAIFSFESILLVDPVDHHRSAPPVDLRGRRARDRPPMVRRSRHHGLVGRSLAERGLRLVDGDQGDRRFASRMGAPARPRRRPRAGDAARFAEDHPPGRPAPHHRRADQPGVRRDHLPEGRGGHHHARGLCRRGCLAPGRPRLYRPPPARQHGDRRSLARDRGSGRPAGHRHRPRFHPPARRAADPGRKRPVRRRAHPGFAPPGPVQPRQPGRAAALLAGAGHRPCRRARAARRRRRRRGRGGRPRLRPAGRQLRPGRLLPDALRARFARPADRKLRAAPAARPDRPARRQLGARRSPAISRRPPRSTWSTPSPPTATACC